MRMRKKKNLETRLAGCDDNLILIKPTLRDFSKADDAAEYIDLDTYFGRTAPLFLEIGCGKGGFICEMAKRHPEINFIAVEQVANVIVSAAEKAKREKLDNILFLCVKAEYLPTYIENGKAERLFLNFSCPYPKKKYASHRLTAQNFLKIYKKLLKEGTEIHFKTDNMGLFEFSIEQMSDFGMSLKNVTLDLHNSEFAEQNIITEYESRFIAEGLPIYRLEATFKK